MITTSDDRQRARDRAADGIAPRDRVICGPDGWTPLLDSPWLSTEDRRRSSAQQRRQRLNA